MKSNIQQGMIIVILSATFLLITDIIFDQSIQEETLYFMLALGFGFIISSIGLYIYDKFLTREKNTRLNTLTQSLIVTIPILVFIFLLTDQSSSNYLKITFIFILSSLIFKKS